MKYLFKASFWSVFILLCVIIIFCIYQKVKFISSKEINISTFPLFSFDMLNGMNFNSSSILKGPVLIIRFHPECEHCQYELNELFRDTSIDTSIKIILISSADRKLVKSFFDKTNITKQSHVITLLDTACVFKNIFGEDIVPSNFIYNKNLKLVRALYGEYKIETIIKYLKYGGKD